MKAMALQPSGSLDHLVLQQRDDPGDPGPGEIRVALHGSSLNFHDLGVATGAELTGSGPLAAAVRRNRDGGS